MVSCGTSVPEPPLSETSQRSYVGNPSLSLSDINKFHIDEESRSMIVEKFNKQSHKAETRSAEEFVFLPVFKWRRTNGTPSLIGDSSLVYFYIKNANNSHTFYRARKKRADPHFTKDTNPMFYNGLKKGRGEAFADSMVNYIRGMKGTDLWNITNLSKQPQISQYIEQMEYAINFSDDGKFFFIGPKLCYFQKGKLQIH